MNYLAVDIRTYFFNNGQFGPSQSVFSSLTGVGSIVSLFLNVAFVIAGIVLVFYFIMGGIGLMSSAGQNDPQKIAQAQKTLTSALIGFIIVFASYWIVSLIGQLFGIQVLGGLFKF